MCVIFNVTICRMKNIGIVINDVNPSVLFGLKYGYGFGYGYNFGYGYGDNLGYYEPEHEKRGIYQKLSEKFYGFLRKFFN